MSKTLSVDLRDRVGGCRARRRRPGLRQHGERDPLALGRACPGCGGTSCVARSRSKPDDVEIRDNLAAHKGIPVRDAVARSIPICSPGECSNDFATADIMQTDRRPLQLGTPRPWPPSGRVSGAMRASRDRAWTPATPAGTGAWQSSCRSVAIVAMVAV